MKFPTVETYGQYSNDNYGAHCLRVTFGDLTLFYSYNTIIAFDNGNERFVRDNDWGPTTGKHLNWIDGGAKGYRIPGYQFENRLAEELLAMQIEV